jgi:hypothetical protein
LPSDYERYGKLIRQFQYRHKIEKLPVSLAEHRLTTMTSIL